MAVVVRRWVDLCGILLPFLLLLLECCSSSAPKLHHRCRSTSASRNETLSLLEDLQLSQCRSCEYQTTTEVPYQAKIHVVILLSTQQTFEKSMVIAAGLLSQGIRVTMLASPALPREDMIRQALAQHIPCHYMTVASSLLTFRQYQMEKLCDARTGDLWCSMMMASPSVTAVSSALSSMNDLPEPDVILTDAAEVAGLLVAEAFLLPSLVLVESDTILRQVLGTPLAGLGWWERLSRASEDRLASIDLTSGFVSLNRVRHHLGLERLRTMADLWKTPGNLLWSSSPTADAYQELMPNLLAYSGPLLPPCVPCDRTLAALTELASLAGGSSEAEPLPAVLVSAAFRNDERGRTSLRQLIQGLSLARASMAEFERCTGEALGCWAGPNDFRVVLMGPSHEWVLPDWITHGQSAFLDVMAMHPPTLALVSLCDPQNAWTHRLGPPVLCLDTNWSPEETALQLLTAIKDHKRKGNATQDDLLERIVTVVKEVAVVKAREGHRWTNGREMGRDIMEQLGLLDKNASKEPAWHSLVVYSASTILLGAAAYMLLKDTALWRTSSFRSRRLQRQSPSIYWHALALLVEDFAVRLPELDRVWAIWQEWVAKVLEQMRETDDSSEATENGHSKDLRKRRNAKKRH